MSVLLLTDRFVCAHALTSLEDLAHLLTNNVRKFAHQPNRTGPKITRVLRIHQSHIGIGYRSWSCQNSWFWSLHVLWDVHDIMHWQRACSTLALEGLESVRQQLKIKMRLINVYNIVRVKSLFTKHISLILCEEKFESCFCSLVCSVKGNKANKKVQHFSTSSAQSNQVPRAILVWKPPSCRFEDNGTVLTIYSNSSCWPPPPQHPSRGPLTTAHIKGPPPPPHLSPFMR